MWLLHILIQNALCFTNLVDSRVASVFSTLNTLSTRWATTLDTVIQLADHAAERLVYRLLEGAATVFISMNPTHFTKPAATLAATNATVANIVHTAISATKCNMSTCTDLIVHPFAIVPPPIHKTSQFVFSYASKEDLQDWPLAMAMLVLFAVVWLIDNYQRESRAEDFSFHDLTTEHMYDIFNMHEQYAAFLDTGNLDGLDAGWLQPRMLDEITPAPLPILIAGITDDNKSVYSNTTELTSIDKLLARRRVKFAEFPTALEEPEAKVFPQLSQVASSVSGARDHREAEQLATAQDFEACTEHTAEKLATAVSQDASGDSTTVGSTEGPTETGLDLATTADVLDRATEDEEEPEVQTPVMEATVVATAAASSTSTAASAASPPELGEGTGQDHETSNDPDFELDRDAENVTSSEETRQDQAEGDNEDDEVFIYPGSEIDVHARGAPCADGDYHAGPSTSSSLEEPPVIYAASGPYASTLRPTANKFVPQCSARSNAVSTEANTTSSQPGEYVYTASTSTLRPTADKFVPAFSARLGARTEATASGRFDEAIHTALSSALRPTAKKFVPGINARSNAHTETTTSDRPGEVIYVATPSTPPTPGLSTKSTVAGSSTGSEDGGSRSGLDGSPQPAAQSFTPCFPIPTWESPECQNYGAGQGPSQAARDHCRGNSWSGNGGPSQGAAYAPPPSYPALPLLPALQPLPHGGVYGGGVYGGGVYGGGPYGGGPYAYSGVYGGGVYAYGGGPYVARVSAYGGGGHGGVYAYGGGLYAYGAGGWWGARQGYSTTWGN